MANGYNISGIRGRRRQRSPYFPNIDQGTIELRNRQAAMGILPSAPGESNPYAPQLASQRPLAPPPLERPLPAIPAPGQDIVTPEWRRERERLLKQNPLAYVGEKVLGIPATIRPELPPLSPAEIAPLEQRYAGEFSLIRDLYKRGFGKEAAVAANQLSQRDSRLARHPDIIHLKGLETAKGLPLSPMDRFQQQKKFTQEINLESQRLTREGKRQEARDVLVPLIGHSPVFDYETPDPNNPVELRTAEILRTSPTANPLYNSIKALAKEIQKPDAPLESLMPRFQALEKQYMVVQEKAYQRALGELAAVTEKQRIDNLANTLSKLTPLEQQTRMAGLTTEDLTKLNQAYPGGLPKAKEQEVTAKIRSEFGTLADSYIEELPEWDTKATKDSLAEQKAAYSPDVLSQQREQFVKDNHKAAIAQGLDNDDLRTIWDQRFRVKLKGKVAPPPREQTAGEPTSSIEGRIKRLRAAGVPEQEIQQALA